MIRPPLPVAECERIFAGESPITVHREHRRWTIEQLADETLLHPNVIERAENGARKLTDRELRRVASALGCQPIDLGNHHEAYVRCCMAAIDADEDLVEERETEFPPDAAGRS